MTEPGPGTTGAEEALGGAHVERPPATAADLQRLDHVRLELLRVHRALLEVERARYEKAHGRIANNSAFLQLVINDPWFDWLRPLAQLVLLIDERTSDKTSPLGTAEARSLFAFRPFSSRRRWRCSPVRWRPGSCAERATMNAWATAWPRGGLSQRSGPALVRASS